MTRTNTAPASTKSAPRKASKAPEVPLARTALNVVQPDPGPVVTRDVIAGSTAQDATNLIDQIGLIKAIAKMEKPLVDDAKLLMLDGKVQVLEGELYIGKLAPAGNGETVDIEKFMTLCRKKGLKDKKIFAALRVSKEDATFVSEDELKTCMVPKEGGKGSGHRLNVDAREGVPNELSDAIRNFAERANKGKIKVPVKVASGKGGKGK